MDQIGTNNNGEHTATEMYTGKHRYGVEFIPLGDRDRGRVVSVYGTDSLEDRGYIDNHKYSKFLQ